MINQSTLPVAWLVTTPPHHNSSTTAPHTSIGASQHDCAAGLVLSWFQATTKSGNISPSLVSSSDSNSSSSSICVFDCGAGGNWQSLWQLHALV
ncbi:hypothetical protein ACLKA6_004886 [Drosophila palustris]